MCISPNASKWVRRAAWIRGWKNGGGREAMIRVFVGDVEGAVASFEVEVLMEELEGGRVSMAIFFRFPRSFSQSGLLA